MLTLLPSRIENPMKHNSFVNFPSSHALLSRKFPSLLNLEFWCVESGKKVQSLGGAKLRCGESSREWLFVSRVEFSSTETCWKLGSRARPGFCSERPSVGRLDRSLCVPAVVLWPRVLSGCKVRKELDLKATYFSGFFAEVVSNRVVPSRRRGGRCSFGIMADPEDAVSKQPGGSSTKALPVKLGGFSIEGKSIGGHETCVMIPGMSIAFDIGRCPQRAISQDFLFISHGHMDHIGGIAMYVATRGLYRMKPPTIFVPKCIKATVEKLLDVYRELDGSQLALKLVGLDIGEEYDMGKGYLVKPFRTYHGVPSQGYVIYAIKKKLKPEYLHLSGAEIKDLKFSGVEIINTTRAPVVAFTGDTTADFIVDEANADALSADLLIMEATFVDDAVTVSHARDYGHIHLSEVAALSSKFQNKNILLIHFSARYEIEEIVKAINSLPEAFQGRVSPLLEGF